MTNEEYQRSRGLDKPCELDPEAWKNLYPTEREARRKSEERFRRTYGRDRNTADISFAEDDD